MPHQLAVSICNFLNVCYQLVLAYLCIFNSIDKKSSIQREIHKKDIAALDYHSWTLGNSAISTNFLFYFCKSWAPFGLPCDSRPDFYLLPIKYLLHWIGNLDTSLAERQREIIGKITIKAKDRYHFLQLWPISILCGFWIINISNPKLDSTSLSIRMLLLPSK